MGVLETTKLRFVSEQKLDDLGIRDYQRGARHLIAVDDKDKFVGYAGKNKDELVGLYVRPPYRRQGVATQLLNRLGGIRTVETDAANQRARNFYQDQGFSPTEAHGKRLIMVKTAMLASSVACKGKTMDEYDQIMYRAFFDEMSSIEKNAMFSKISAAPGFLSQLWRGGKQLVRNPGSAGTAMSKSWQRGVAKAAPDAGGLSKGWSGLKGVAGTPQGKAALVGGGTALAGAGSLGYALHK
jgi:hypothetical protein